MTSAVEFGIGVACLAAPDPTMVTKVAGTAMVYHGGANTVAALTSLISYLLSDGEVELSTSALGIVGQKSTEAVLYIATGREDVANKLGSLVGGTVDFIDSIGATLITPNPEIISKIILNGNSALNISGDAILFIEDLQDKGLIPKLVNAEDSSTNAPFVVSSEYGGSSNMTPEQYEDLYGENPNAHIDIKVEPTS